MSKPFVVLMAAAATLAAASCTQDKKAAIEAATTPAADTAVVLRDGAAPVGAATDATTDTASYRTDADRLTDRIAQDLRLTDTVVVTRIERTYYTRGRKLRDLETQYATDTAGRYAAQRAVNDETDRTVRTIITDPTQYRTYESNRTSYYAGTPYSGATVAPQKDQPSTAPRRKGPAVVKYERDGKEVKIEYANGTKVKIDEDGDRKTKYANGRKVKYDADDNERKVKE